MIDNSLNINSLVDSNFTKKIIIVDGYSANGKLLISKFLQTFDRVQKMEVDHIFTEIGSLFFLNKIDFNSTLALLNIRANNTLNNILLSRETNFRPSDESSVFKTSEKIKYFKQLFMKDGDNVIKRIEDEKPILHLMTHFSKPFMDIYFSAFKNKLTYISCTRHPVYFFDHWRYIFNNIISNNPRMQGIGVLKNSINIPWYLLNILKFENINFKNVDNMIIDTIDNLNTLSAKSFKKLSDSEKNNYIEIPFEDFIMNTHNFINKFHKEIDINHTNDTFKLLKKEYLPMQYFSDRNMKRIKSTYKVDRFNVENQNKYEGKLNLIKKNTTKSYFDKLISICLSYEKKHNIKHISTKEYIGSNK